MNQEAIEFFEALKQDEYAFTARDKEMFDVAIQALEQEPYDDAKYHEEHGEVIVDKAVWEDAKRALEQEPKTGHWEWLTEDKYRCSSCNHETRVDECMAEPMYDFCPFCGARMD